MGARRTGKDLTGGPGSSVERAVRWADAAWERRAGQRCWAAERAQGKEGVGRLAGRAVEESRLGWCGLLGQEGRSGPPGWVGFGFFFSYFFPLFYFKHHSNLFEFKLKFEFNSYAFKQNKTMHQHECTNILTL